MIKEEAIDILESQKNEHYKEEINEALDMAISALKDIEKIQIIVDAYFTRGSKSGYECMVEIDRFLEPYKEGE